MLGYLASRGCANDVRFGSVQGGVSLDDLGNNDGDVVSPAASVGICCEQIDDVFEIGGAEVLGDRVVIDETA